MENQNAYINLLDYYIPENQLIFKDHTAFFENTENGAFQSADDFLTFSSEVLGLTGIRNEIELSLEEMIVNLLDKNVDDGAFDPDDIDYIIIANDFGHQLVNFGHYIQDQFEMEKAQTFHLTDNYCTNIDLAIGLASKLVLAAKGDINILIITGLRLKDNLEKRIIGNYGVLGDAAGIAIVSNKSEDAKYQVVDQCVVTQGVLYEMDYVQDNTILHFKSYTQALQQVLKENNVEASGISKVILHNCNRLLMEEILSMNKINLETVDRTSLDRFGHLGATDLILNLNESKKCIDENVLSLNLGVAGTYVSTLFKQIN